MAAPTAFTKMEVKSFNSPDEVRTPTKTRVEIVWVGGQAIGRITLEPGWRWSECIKPVAKTDLCQITHMGCLISGRITVQMKDGTLRTIGPGESYAIPPGHDAWVEGHERVVGLELLSAEQYAKP